MNINLAAIILAALPFTAVDKTSPDTEVRHITGKYLSETLQKGLTPDAVYSQVLLAKHSGYQLHVTARGKSGQAEIHDDWNDNIFILDGECSFIVGGVAGDAKEREPGERRGTAITGGSTMAMHTGDYLFVPPGTPHQMIMAPGQHVKFIGFKTHK
jgi:glyoxylate utilization-related uncharacterized protein